MFCVMAVGATLSSTVTTALAVATFPFTSVTMRSTSFVPTCEQSKAVWLKAKDAIPQASSEPLSTSAVVMEAFPAASS